MNFNKFNPAISEDSRVYIGVKDINGIPIKELDVLLFENIKNEYFFVEYDYYYCSFRLRSSKTYKSSREYKSGGKIVGCILDFDLEEPLKEYHNTTSTYSKWSNKNSKQVLKQMGI